LIANSASVSDLLKLQQKINERLVLLEKRVDHLLASKSCKRIDSEKFGKLSRLFKRVEKKQIVI
jgi:hypothetical protein